MPSSTGCLSPEPEKVMVMCQELHRPSSLPGAISSDAVPKAEQFLRSHCCSGHRAAVPRNLVSGHSQEEP